VPTFVSELVKLMNGIFSINLHYVYNMHAQALQLTECYWRKIQRQGRSSWRQECAWCMTRTCRQLICF